MTDYERDMYRWQNSLEEADLLFPACLSCPAYFEGKRLHEKEILGDDREEETKKIINRIKKSRKEE